MFWRRFVPLRDVAERGVLVPQQGFRPLLLAEYVWHRLSLRRLTLSQGKMTFVLLKGIIHIIYPDKIVWLLKIIKLVRTESIPQFQKFFQVFRLKLCQFSLETYLMLVL